MNALLIVEYISSVSHNPRGDPVSEGPYTNISVEDASNLVRQVGLLFAGEEFYLAKRIEGILRAAFPDLRANAETSAIAAAIRRQVDRLAAQRLLANDANIRLMSEDDIDDIVAAVLGTEELSVYLTDRERLSKVAGVVIGNLLAATMVVGGDPYVGMWTIAEALATTAAEQGVNVSEALNLDNALDFKEFRASVFRACMTCEGWMFYAQDIVDSYALDDTVDPGTWDQIIAISKAYFLERAHEIWPRM